ncbi:MAG: protein kinase [Myxococcota bacterium]
MSLRDGDDEASTRELSAPIQLDTFQGSERAQESALFGLPLSQLLVVGRPPQQDRADRLLSQRISARLGLGDGERTTVGRFVLERKLGQGGVGAVYEAKDPKLGRTVALKVLSIGSAVGCRSTLIRGGAAALQSEARTLARISHPNIVRVFEIGEHDDEVFIVMEQVDGANLHDWMARHRAAPLPTKLQLLHGAALGLEAAHEVGIIHGDIKPGNILVDRGNQARLADFGLAAPMDDCSNSQAPTVAGTPSYMAPEQLEGSPASVRSDIHAFCVTAIEIISGERVFTRDNDRRGSARFEAEIAGLLRSAPSRLRRVLARGVAPDPHARPESMAEVVAAFEPKSSRRWQRWIPSGFGAMGLAVALMAGSQTEEPCEIRAQQVQSVWNSGRLETMTRAFDDSGLGFAHSAASRTGAVLSDYATRWEQGASLLCRVREEIDDREEHRRVACLQRGLASLESLVDTLENADRATVESATKAAVSLPPLVECMHYGTGTELEVPPAANEALTEALARATTAIEIGNYERARVRLEQLLVDASGAPDAFVAEVAYELARAEVRLGRFEDAQRHLHDAYERATLVDDVALAGTVANALADVFGYHLDRYEAGEVWARVATGALGRAPDDIELEVSVLQTRAGIFHRQGRYDEALAALEQARERLSGDDTRSRVRLAVILNDLAVTYINDGERGRAKPLLRQSIALSAEILGESHPELAPRYYNLATLEKGDGDFETAQGLVRRAIAAWRDSRGMVSVPVGNAKALLAQLDLYTGNLDGARDNLADARRIMQALHPDGTPDLAAVTRFEGELALIEGRLDDALDRASAATEIQRSYAPEHFMVMLFLDFEARVWLAKGEPEQALEVLADASTFADSQRHGELVRRVLELTHAHALRAVGRHDDARVRAEPALEYLRGSESTFGRAAISAWDAGEVRRMNTVAAHRQARG